MAEPLPMPAGLASIENLKVPPHSIEAEQSVLGGLMLNNRAMDDVVDRVAPEDFYRHDHRLVFTVLGELHERGQPFDVVTVSESLARKHLLADAGGLAYLGELARNTPSAANIVAYADIVRERSVMRQLIRVANEIAGNAFNPEGRSVPELLDDAETRVFQIAEGRQRGSGPVALKDIAPAVVDRIRDLAANPGSVTGIPTGFDLLDDKTSGLHKGDLVIVAGRPSMGKTTFAMNIAENAMLKSGKPVLVFSMEMPRDQIVLRMLSSFGRIDQGRLRTGNLDPEDWDRLVSAFALLREQKLYVDDTPALSPTELRARARRVARESGGELGMIIIDYLQLMQVPGSQENRATEISAISRSLKAVAKELGVPVVALSQLNRSLEQRPDKRPVMSDLRESGAIEQDADIIMFVFREEVYLKDENPKDKDRLEQVRGTAEIIIGKQRNGPIGTVRLAFLGKYTRFENLANAGYEEYQG
ncbi:MAG: replicative DNA helicase [Gammaproteobacteria bacterium]